MAVQPVFIAAPQASGSATFIPAGTTVTSLLNQSSTQVGTVLNNGVARSNHTLLVITGTGVSGGVVTLVGSNDGTNFYTTSTTVTTSAASTVYAANLANFPFQYVAAKITTAITGGTITAEVTSC